MYAAAPRAVLFTRLPSQWGGSERRRAAQGSRWRRTVAIESVRGCAGVWASPRAAETATLVFGRALPQIEMRERRRVLSVRSASSGRSSGAGENRRRSEFFRARAGVRYDYSFCQSREQRNTAFPGALYLHRELLSNRCISSLIETAAETHSFLPVSLRPRACPSFHATTRQRRELSYTATAQKCSPPPCAAPRRKAVAS